VSPRNEAPSPEIQDRLVCIFASEHKNVVLAALDAWGSSA